jgi:uncharacterized protein (DUF2235 family)
MIGGMFGWGLKRNVIDLYCFLCRTHNPGDEIYGIGFSRGAFTIRVLAKFILDQGLIVNNSSQDDLRANAVRLWRDFRRSNKTKFGLATLGRLVRDVVVHPFNPDPPAIKKDISIRFLGLWDTVDAYGLPIRSLQRGIDEYIVPLSLDDKHLDSTRIAKACHAIALDDSRASFHPLLWDEANLKPSDDTDKEALTQVFFCGAHANVGGGYPDDALSTIPLLWMIGEAKKTGVEFNEQSVELVRSQLSANGKIYNSRGGLGAYYRFKPRWLSSFTDRQGAVITNVKIHESVDFRINTDTNYGPLCTFGSYRIVKDDRFSDVGTKEERNTVEGSRPQKLRVLKGLLSDICVWRVIVAA